MTSRKNETVEIEEALRAALDSAALSSPNSGGIVVSATRNDLAADLRSFGEETIAGRIASLTEAKLCAIFERASVGVVDELEIALAPVLFGGGRRLFENLREPAPQFRIDRVLDSQPPHTCAMCVSECGTNHHSLFSERR